MIQALVELADKRGYVTYEQIVEALDDDGDDRAALRNLLYELNELGIELRRDGDGGPRKSGGDFAEHEFERRPAIPSKIVADLSAVSSDDPVGLYFRQMAQEPLLTATDEIDLAKRIERGFKAKRRLDNPDVMDKSARWRRHLRRLVFDGQCAREHLGRANTRLVVSIAKRYMGQGLPFPDLIQEGNVGLMRAVDKYDYSRGNRFSTYATWWIRQAITRALAQKTRTIRIPLHMTERIRQMYRAAQDLEQTLGQTPDRRRDRHRYGSRCRCRARHDGCQPACHRPGAARRRRWRQRIWRLHRRSGLRQPGSNQPRRTCSKKPSKKCWRS